MGSWERQGLGEEMVREGVRKSKEQRAPSKTAVLGTLACRIWISRSYKQKAQLGKSTKLITCSQMGVQGGKS